MVSLLFVLKENPSDDPKSMPHINHLCASDTSSLSECIVSKKRPLTVYGGGLACGRNYVTMVSKESVTA